MKIFRFALALLRCLAALLLPSPSCATPRKALVGVWLVAAILADQVWRR